MTEVVHTVVAVGIFIVNMPLIHNSSVAPHISFSLALIWKVQAPSSPTVSVAPVRHSTMLYINHIIT